MERPETPFDEKAALEELERLRDAIQSARRARLAKSDEFDDFVKGFKKPVPPPPPYQPDPPPAAPTIDLPTPAPVAELLTLTPAPEPEPPPLTETPEPSPQIPQAAEPLASERTSLLPPPAASAPVASKPRQPKLRVQGDPVVRILGALAVVAVAFIGALVYWSRGPSTRVVEAPANVVQPQPAPVQQAPPVQAPPPAAPAPVANVNVELRTLQPVWMRVTVDGEKQREGTVPAGERLDFHADRAVIVRVGNGADVVVKSATGENPLGVAGQPVTWTFTKGGGKS